MGTELETRLWLWVANVFCCGLIESSPIRSLAGRLPYGDWLTGQLAEVYLIYLGGSQGRSLYRRSGTGLRDVF